MRKFLLLGVLAGLAVLVAPAGALAGYNGTDCSYVTGGHGSNDIPPPVGPDPGGNQVYVYTSGGRTSDSVAGACVNAPGSPVQGGSAEVGNGAPGTYAVIDGDDANPDPIDGYGALSNYETAPPSGDCPLTGAQTAGGGGTNAGGCVGIKSQTIPGVGTTPQVNLPVPLIACGNTSGDNWESTPRDGCFIP